MVGKSLRAWRLPFSSKQRATFVRDTSYFLFLFAACGIPAIVFVNDNVCRLQEIKGSSMYPYLNKDFNTTTKHDLGLVWKYRAMEDIERGMIVCLWYELPTQYMDDCANVGKESLSSRCSNSETSDCTRRRQSLHQGPVSTPDLSGPTWTCLGRGGWEAYGKG